MDVQEINLEQVKIRLSKRIFDILLSALLLSLTFPLSLIIILAILIEGLVVAESGGSPFYVEIRISKGEPFGLIKFRIFKVRAILEEIRPGILTTKEVENKPENLTHVGKYLKKYGLDELPQLLNILMGDMSFVGPRPRPIREYQSELKDGIYYRKVIRAGLTGLAQIRKGIPRSFEEDIAKDAEYVEKSRRLSALQLLKLDIWIIFRTIRVVIKGTGE